MMKLIVITAENIFEKEAEIINLLFENGLEVLHLRKPDSSSDNLKNLISEIDVQYHNRIVLHDHFELVDKFDLKGVHLNRRNPVAPAKTGLSISRSCHSLEEVKEYRDKSSYMFLSPVFNSISKEDYASNFSEEALLKAKEDGIINDKIFALGGVFPQNIEIIRKYGFGGAVILGYLWGNVEDTGDYISLLKRFKELLSLI